MKLLDWIAANRPGRVIEHDDRYEIEHESGDYSTLFKKSKNCPTAEDTLEKLGDIYTNFDGIDLFSSTFKIASLEGAKSEEGVKLVSSLEELRDSTNILNPQFPEKATLFMYEAGIGYYAIGEKTGKIYKWDSELGTLTDEFDSVEEIFKEWIDAVA